MRLPEVAASLRSSFNAENIIVRPRSVHGFERLCWATTNTVPFRGNSTQLRIFSL